MSVRTASSAWSRVGRVCAGFETGGLEMSFILISFRPAVGCAGPLSVLVEAPRFLRAVEGEGGNADEESLAGRRFHLIIADHKTRRRCERAGAGIFEALTRLQHRLFADNAWPAYLLQPAQRVGNAPMSVAQLHG